MEENIVLLGLLDEAVRDGRAGECTVCGRVCLRLVRHHWFELPDRVEHECMVCEACNAVLFPDNLWVGANVGVWTGRPVDYIRELDHVLPSLVWQRWWMRGLWEPYLYQGLHHVASSPSFRESLAFWERVLEAEYAIVATFVSERNQRRRQSVGGGL